MPRTPPSDHTLIVPPTLPPSRVVPLPERGEFFVRTVDGPPGSSLPVLLIHGWQATADLNFHPLYAALGAHHTVVAADLRGHGRSVYRSDRFTIEAAADDHAALLDHLGIGRAIVVGYSLGTAVAQSILARHPRRVAAMVLAAGELGGRHRPHEHVYNWWGGWLGTMQRLTSGRWSAHRLIDKAERDGEQEIALRAWVAGEMERGHVGSLREAGRALATFDGRRLAAEHAGEVPVAVVQTLRDRLVRPERQRALAKAWGAERIELDADHDAPVAHPAAFTDAILEAVGRVRADRETRAAV